MIQDSGNRREFESGAVRDMAEGKGRCDLLPLRIVADYIQDFRPDDADVFRCFSDMLHAETYIEKVEAAHSLLNYASCNVFADTHDMLLEVAKHYEEGAKKYDERNWEKGIPLWCFVDSGVRHFIKLSRGDKDERHDRAFVWNVLGYLYTLECEEMRVDD